MQNTKQQKAKDSAGGIVGYLVSIVISAVVIIYLGYHFLSSFGAEMTTEYALMITENDMVEFDAYILRNETVVCSTVTGGSAALCEQLEIHGKNKVFHGVSFLSLKWTTLVM